MEEENIWRPVDGYEGIYEVNIPGVVRSLDRIDCRGHRIKGKVLAQTLNKSNGYLQVKLWKNGGKKTHKVHIIVSTAFQDICGPRFEGCEVDHLDTNPLNNSAYNLRNCTHSDNMNNPITKKAMSEAMKRKVVQLTLDGGPVRIWEGMMDVERELGYDNSHISSCCQGKRKTAYGYKWMYLDKYIKQRFRYKVRVAI